MFPLGQTHLGRVLLPLLATLHLSAASTGAVATTAAPGGSNATLTGNYSVEGAKVVHPYTPCGSDYAHYCGNGGQCIFPQDTDKPSCICTSSFKGKRCLLAVFSDHSRALPELEQLVAICIGLAMVVVTLVVVACCVLRKRCMKSALLVKLAPESSV
ncbi:epigen-like [Takifugu flavidus]|uniref:epigen-like n=1 Tax=Takifugu flavidus TaxID=433684 RepID=UPI002544CDD2|nr:epigen-like [Takifugu flavidus]